MGASSRDAGPMTEINVTPLVDVVLVLLVLMMMTATAIANRTISLELPKAKSGESGSPTQPLLVAVDANGALFLGTEPADDTAVRARARAAASFDPDVSAVLAADGKARHERVVHAMELLRAERVAKIAIVVRAEGTSP